MESVDLWGQLMSSDTYSGTLLDDSLLEFSGSSRSDGHIDYYHSTNVYSGSFHSFGHPAFALSSPVEYGHLTNPFFQQSPTSEGSATPQHQQFAMQQQYPQQAPMQPQFPSNLRAQTHHYDREHDSPVYGSYPQSLSADMQGHDDALEIGFNSQRRSSRASEVHCVSRFSEGCEISNASTIFSSTLNGSSVSSLRTITAPPVRTRQQQYERTRQKNRAAASKCRQKTKQNDDDLRVREHELSCQKQILMLVAKQLQDEVLALKHEILLHGSCDCEYIQKYLNSAANQIA